MKTKKFEFDKAEITLKGFFAYKATTTRELGIEKLTELFTDFCLIVLNNQLGCFGWEPINFPSDYEIRQFIKDFADFPNVTTAKITIICKRENV